MNKSIFAGLVAAIGLLAATMIISSIVGVALSSVFETYGIIWLQKV
ncbi:MAG: hypothetical protein ACRD8W_31495 [Nitrososphaeraceae archaeon]